MRSRRTWASTCTFSHSAGSRNVGMCERARFSSDDHTVVAGTVNGSARLSRGDNALIRRAEPQGPSLEKTRARLAREALTPTRGGLHNGRGERAMLPRYADTHTRALAWVWLKRRHLVVSALVRLLCPGAVVRARGSGSTLADSTGGMVVQGADVL